MPELSFCANPHCTHPQNGPTAITCASCGEPLVLHGRYRLVKLLGQGGFGRTFKAIDEQHPQQKYCAVKQFLPQQLQAQEKATELFEQEATRLKNLGEHPQIPTLYEHFQTGDRQYLVQEFIDGQNLAQELKSSGKFTAIDIRNLLTELLPVLRLIHLSNVIHRDIKPENIIRRLPTKPTEKSTLVLVDFGASKHATETTLGKTGTVIGSAAFIAPEQVRGKATFASDLYSLGVTCIHLLTAIAPFDLLDTGDNKWVWQDFVDKKFDPQLTKILNKLLEPATNRRYQLADDVLEALYAPAKQKWFSIKGAIAASLVLGMGVVGGNALLNPLRRRVNPPAVFSGSQQANLSPIYAGLYATINGKEQNLTLKHTNVEAEVAGNISEVEVTQVFSNPYDKPLEAIYKFPLPDDAAVDDMEIKIGNQIIRGEIKRSEEAVEIYEEAKEEGKTAALLEQERDNIFQQSLANILPGEEIEVTIRYSNSLRFEGENYEFIFPMVVAPRYSADDIQASGLGAIAAQSKVPQRRSGQDISVNLEIDAGVPIQNLTSPTHEITTQILSSSTSISLANSDEIPNKDLIVRYQVTGKATQSTMLTQADQRGGHFATYLIPAVDYQTEEIVPKDVVFLMDTSGSQAGAAIAQSKALMTHFVEGLNPQDTFTIIDFSSATKKLSQQPLKNTEKNRARAQHYIDRINAGGGTNLMNGINEVVNFPETEDGRLRTVVLLTDGLIGDDRTIIGMIENQLKPGNRIFTFGVGPSTNHFLLNRLAEVGRGESEIIPEQDDPQEVVAEFFEEIENPILTNVKVSWLGEGTAPEIYPEHMPDLYDNQPLVLHGKKGDRHNGQLKVIGTMAGGETYEKIFDVNFDQVQGNGAIAQLWGRAKIKEYMNDMYWQTTTEGVNTVTNTALDYRLVSDYTSFVAVSDEIRVNPNAQPFTKDIPLETSADVELGSSAGSSTQSAETLTQKTAQAPLVAPTSAPAVTNAAPSNQTSGHSSGTSKDVPEPSQIIGNLLALLTLGFFFWKRRQAKKLAKMNKIKEA